MNNDLDDILKLIYGKDVVEYAYASPAGRLTKANARTEIQAYTLAEVNELIGEDLDYRGNSPEVMVNQFKAKLRAKAIARFGGADGASEKPKPQEQAHNKQADKSSEAAE